MKTPAIDRNQNSDLRPFEALLVVKTNFLGAEFSGEEDGGTYKYFLVHGDGSAITPVKTNWYLVRGDELTPGEVTPPADPNPTPPPGEEEPPPEVVVPTPLNPIQDLTNAANAAIGSYSAIMPMFYADMGRRVSWLLPCFA